MKKTLAAFTLLSCLSAFEPARHNDEFKKLFALEGTWLMQTKKGFIGEEWKKISDDQMKGRGFFIKGTDTVTTENITLSNRPDAVVYTPVVENQNNGQPVDFIMTGSDNNRFVFENQAHDFPKRIVYKLVNADSIHAFVDDGTDTGKRLNFFYSRKKQ